MADAKSSERKKAAVEHPDTPSGKGLAAAEGKSDDEAADAYHKARKEARWG